MRPSHIRKTEANITFRMEGGETFRVLCCIVLPLRHFFIFRWVEKGRWIYLVFNIHRHFSTHRDLNPGSITVQLSSQSGKVTEN